MRSLESYPMHGGQLRLISKMFGIPQSQLIDFSANINPDGPPAAVMSALRASLDSPTTLTEYPDLEQAELKETIASYAGIATTNIVVANGFVPLLEAVLRTLPIRRCFLPVPSFAEYRKTLERANIEIVPHVLDAGSSFNYDSDALLAGEHDAVLLANPQNPSGVCHDADAIRDIASKASKRNIYLLLDEAFIDYLPEHSLTTAIGEFANLVVFRSVTKFHGIPGLRVAYAASNPALSASVSANLPPWPISTLASSAVSAALNDQAYAVRARAENLGHRDELQLNLDRLALQVYPSAANFVLFQLPSRVDPDAFWRHMIAEHHMVLRSCANFEALPRGHFRAAVRTQHENRQLSAAIAESLASLLTSAGCGKTA
jgi:threonine-phosphate decarboxylase